MTLVQSVRLPDDEQDAIVAQHRRLIHEFEVHQLELELQNQTLREAQTVLEESRARYFELYDTAPVGHLTLDRFGVIRELNLACANLLGYGRRFLLGRPLRSYLTPESRRSFDTHLLSAFRSHLPLGVELEIVHAEDESRRIVELVSVPRLSSLRGQLEEGESVFHSVMVNISEHKREERQQLDLLKREHEARVLAERGDRVKREFLTLVSHELRSPLAPMMMWVQALRVGGAGETLRGRAVEALDTCLKTMVAMIDDLVDVARGQHGKLRVERRPMDLQPVLRAAVEAHAPSAAAKHLTVALQVEPASAWVAGDSTRLQQVVSNLLSNAIKFTPEAGHVTLELRTSGQNVVLTVRDDGEGIEASLLESIFEPFRQHDDTTPRRHGGLGLGLTIVRHLVREHGGEVVAESPGMGRGSCFTVTLPGVGEVSVRPAGRVSAGTELGASSAPRALDCLRILVVDDDDAIREALAATLRRYGAEVTTAVSAAAGRIAFERARPDVIVSDVSMPEETGYTFMRKLRAREGRTPGAPRVPTIALTAHASERDRARALAAGFDRHVTKPIEFEGLVSAIGALARRPL